MPDLDEGMDNIIELPHNIPELLHAQGHVNDAPDPGSLRELEQEGDMEDIVDIVKYENLLSYIQFYIHKITYKNQNNQNPY